MAANDVTIRFRGDTSHLLRSVRQVEKSLKRVNTAGDRASKSVAKIGNSANQATGALRAMVGALAGASLFSFIDNMQQADNMLRVATKSSQEFEFAQRAALETAQRYGVGLNEQTSLVASLARNQDKLGYNINQSAMAAEALTAGLYASGVGGAQANSVITQFNQILAKGKVNGDEFTTIMENLGGPVMDLVAENMGVTTAELIDLKEKGLIGAKDFTDALIRSLDDLRNMGGKSVLTLGQSVQRVQNSFATFLKRVENATGILAKTASAFDFLGKNIKVVVTFASAFVGILAIGKIASIIAGIVRLTKAIRTMGVGLAVAQAFATGGISAITALAGATAVAAGAYALFPDEGELDKNLVDPIDDATTATDNLNNTLADTPGQLQGITDKYKEILTDLDNQIRLSKLSNDEREIEAELLRINKSLSDKMTESQKALVAEKLREVQANERNVTLLQDQGRAIREFSHMYQDSVDKAVEAHTKLQTMLELGITSDEYEKQLEQNLLNDKQFQQAALDNAKGAIRRAIQDQVSKYDTLYDLQVEHQRKVSQITWMLTKDELGAIQLTEDERKILNQTLIKMEQDLAHEKFKLQDQEVERARQRNKEIQDINLRRISRVYEAEAAAGKAIANENTSGVLQEIGRQERIQKIVNDRIEFEKKSETEKWQWAVGQAGSAFEELGRYNKKAFEASKALRIAEAIMNTYQAATLALATYPPPFGFIGAAVAVAAGLANVATIRSQQYTGRQLGGAVSMGDSYLVGETGPEIFTPGASGRIDRIEGSQAPVDITFNINAVDAASVDELLIQRKGTIQQVISDAMLERGQRSRF